MIQLNIQKVRQNYKEINSCVILVDMEDRGFRYFWLNLGWNKSTGEGYLLSRGKAVKDVNARVGFCFLVGVILNFDWSIFS